MELDESLPPLHATYINKLSIFINRSHTLLHSLAIAFYFYYRASFFTLTLPCLLLFASELLFSFIWLLEQAYRWRPISRTVFPHRLPRDDLLPPIDVFICTADPDKEPALEVMNTVISAMALDYPFHKLHVYLSDDGGSAVTLNCMREASVFAKWWLPFCRTYGLKTRCPAAYFAAVEDGHDGFSSPEYIADQQRIKGEYEKFKKSIKRIKEDKKSNGSPGNHSTVIEVINRSNSIEDEMPLLVYVSREKRPNRPHHFKAGALNILLRVSALISNSDYILALDCDMYCNDPTSARQAMCFHLDPNSSPSLAFVQFPQKFRNISKNDIYDSQLREAFSTYCHGLDGLEGPIVCGTGFYIKRTSLLGYSINKRDIDIVELKECFGLSNEFIKSLGQKCKPEVMNEGDLLLQEIQLLSSCAYENNTKWGEEVGFLYYSVVEDYFTGFKSLHCKGWTSVYCDPPRPQFLGNGVTNLNDLLVQGTRWSSGLVEVALSPFFPLIYGPLHKMSLLHSMCYAHLSFFPFYFLPLWCFATIPQLCLLHGISLYPHVSSSFFPLLVFIFVSSLSKHLHEVVTTGGSIQTWINEERIWMIKSITSHSYGSLDAIMKRIGMREASFIPTNKVEDDEQVKLYQMGKYDFQTSTRLLVPLVTLVIFNTISLVGGISRVIIMGNWEMMVAQILLSIYILIMSYPVIEGMALRKDKGRIPPSVTILSSIFSVIFLSFGYVMLMY